MTKIHSDVLERPDTRATDDGDHERFRHYYRKTDLETAWMDGKPIRALCGKVDVPMRDPDRYPTCKTCEEKLNEYPE